jgi:hypothetical protein
VTDAFGGAADEPELWRSTSGERADARFRHWWTWHT